MAINAPELTMDQLVQLIKYDSNYGQYEGEIQVLIECFFSRNSDLRTSIVRAYVRTLISGSSVAHQSLISCSPVAHQSLTSRSSVAQIATFKRFLLVFK